MTIHVISARPSSDPVAARDALGRAIANLSRLNRTDIWFHDYRDNLLGGAPVVMLECPDDFMAKVRLLPQYGSERALLPGVGTERKDTIKVYFFTPKPQPPFSPHMK